MDKMNVPEPTTVLEYFAKISEIPRGSGNMDAISAYVTEECKRLGANAFRDETMNVIAMIPATPGFEDRPAVMLQAHLDMVAEKTPDSDHDFLKDPIKLIREGDLIHADRTTLGADNGLAVAMMLAYLSDKTVSHPALEFLFTTDEETGMDGAINVDLSFSNAVYMLNMDTEDESVFTVSCAGGTTLDAVLPLKRVKREGVRQEIVISSKKGGHSGCAIHLDRPNTNVVGGNLLADLVRDHNVSFVSLDGGKAYNAIPMQSVLSIVSDEAIDLKPYEEAYQLEYCTTDDNVTFTVQNTEKGAFEVADEKTENDLLYLLISLPNGAIDFNHFFTGLTETSLNLGRMRTSEDTFTVGTLIRSSVATKQARLAKRFSYVAERANAAVIDHGSHPGWAYKVDSALRDQAVKVWDQLYPEEKASVNATHGGLECGLLLAKKPEMEVISFGPNAYRIHTPEEAFSVSSASRVYAFLVKLLEELR